MPPEEAFYLNRNDRRMFDLLCADYAARIREQPHQRTAPVAPNLQVVKASSATATSGRYPGHWYEYDFAAKTLTQKNVIWIVFPNSSTPDTAKYMRGMQFGFLSSDGVPIFMVIDASVGATTFTGPINFTETEAAITASQNNYVISDTANYIYLTGANAISLTGIVAPSPETARTFIVRNDKASDVTWVYNSGSSTAGNRFYTTYQGDLIQESGELVMVTYDTVNNRWVVTPIGDSMNETKNTVTIQEMLTINDAADIKIDGDVFLQEENVTISSNQNNYSLPAGTTVLRADITTALDITGFGAPANGLNQAFYFVNIGTGTVTFKHQSASSTAANRFQLPGAADLTFATHEMGYVWYDDTSNYWRVVKYVSDSGGAAHTETNDQQALGSPYAISADDTWEATGLSVSLPEAGTYLLTGRVIGNGALASGTTGSIKAKLRNTTDAADIANSIGYCVSAETTTGNNFGCYPVSDIVTVAGAKDIEVYGWRDSGPSWMSANIMQDSILGYVKLSD